MIHYSRQGKTFFRGFWTSLGAPWISQGGILQLPPLKGQHIQQQTSTLPAEEIFSSSSTTTVCTGFVKTADLWWWSSREEFYQILPNIFMPNFTFWGFHQSLLSWEETPLLSTRTLQIPELPLQDKLQNLAFNNLFISRKKFPAIPSTVLNP